MRIIAKDRRPLFVRSGKSAKTYHFAVQNAWMTRFEQTLKSTTKPHFRLYYNRRKTGSISRAVTRERRFQGPSISQRGRP
jgi:hypothetical protein